MTAHLTEEQLEAYRTGRMMPDEVVSAAEHLAHCDLCRQTLAHLPADRPDPLQVEFHRPFEHVSDDLIRRHLRGLLAAGERDAVEDHLEHCPLCQSRARDLHAREGDAPLTGRVRVSRWLFGVAAAAALLAIGGLGWFQGQLRPIIRTPRTPKVTSQAKPIPRPPLALTDGGRQLAALPDGTVSNIGDLPPAVQDLLRQVFQTKRLPITPLPSDLTGKDDPAPKGGAAPAFRLLAPVGVLIETDQPTFSWEKWKGSWGYRVFVYDNNYDQVASSARLSNQLTQWRAPVPLRRGERYRWRVWAKRLGEEVIVPSLPIPEARFQVLAAEAAQELAAARQRYPNFHLLLAALYARAGLLREAEREMEQLIAANPNNGAVAQLATDLRQELSSH